MSYHPVESFVMLQGLVGGGVPQGPHCNEDESGGFGGLVLRGITTHGQIVMQVSPCDLRSCVVLDWITQKRLEEPCGCAQERRSPA
eukprot:1755982-Prymnesium_polylepis.4